MKKLLILCIVLMLAAPAMAGRVFTEMVQMDMTGDNPFGTGGQIVVTLDPTRPSSGEVASDTDFPAESFFDVYVRVEVPVYGAFRLLGGETGVHLTAELNQLPPAQDDEYIDEGDVQKMLESEDDPQVMAGIIYEILHQVGNLTDWNDDLPSGKIREYFDNSTAQIRVQLEDFGPEEFVIDLTGSYVVERIAIPGVPSHNIYGLVILALLLLATGAYLYYRRRRTATA